MGLLAAPIQAPKQAQDQAQAQAHAQADENPVDREEDDGGSEDIFPQLL